MNMNTVVLKKIQKSIKDSLGLKELSKLCSALQLSPSGKKTSLQDRLLNLMNKLSYEALKSVANEVECILNCYNYTPKQINTNVHSSKPEFICDDLSQEVLNTALIKLDSEVISAMRKNLVVVNFTQYPSSQSAVYTKSVPGINERTNIQMIPNNLLYVKVQASPYYCCPVCIHPLCYMVPTQSPHIPQNGSKVTSKFSLNFYLSANVLDLINCHKMKLDKNKVFYKWQILLRFIAIDPSKQLPIPNESVPQTIPPYLSVSVNNENISLWEVLPSNCKAKEGRRHPKPVNITDKITARNHNTNGYKQNVSFTWYQTPDLFQYYYVGVYLERKLSLREVLSLFSGDKRDNIIHTNETLRLIRNKLGNNKRDSFSNGGDDDLVISSVLPMSLCCPIGRSRIAIPLRTLKCQHLQCFDAMLFLSMNERRSQWKCPVCECKATPIDLFVCKYTQDILETFKDDDEVIEVNVKIDGSYVPIRQKDKFEQDQSVNKASNDNNEVKTNEKALPTIILDSDDEDESPKENISKTTDKEKTPVNEPERPEKEMASLTVTEPMETASVAHPSNKSSVTFSSLNLNDSSTAPMNASQPNDNLLCDKSNNEVVSALDINFLKQSASANARKSPMKFPVANDTYREVAEESSEDESINSDEYQDDTCVDTTVNINKVESTTFSVTKIMGLQSHTTISSSTTNGNVTSTQSPKQSIFQQNSVIARVTIDLTDDLDDSMNKDKGDVDMETSNNDTNTANIDSSSRPFVSNNSYPFRNANNQYTKNINEKVKFYSNQMNSSKWIPFPSENFKQTRTAVGGDTVVSNGNGNRSYGKRKIPSINHMRVKYKDCSAVYNNSASNGLNKIAPNNPFKPRLQQIGTANTIDLTSDDESPPTKKIV